ncbi:hypothetical protein GCM10027614_60740 [Micromonospora vulcania]
MVWPGTAVHEVPEPTPNAVFAAVQGYDQAAVLAGDVPDLPGLTVGKLLRPLTTRPVAVAPVEGGGPGLLGVAVRLPVPGWLPRWIWTPGRPPTCGLVLPDLVMWRSPPAGGGCAARPTWRPWTRPSKVGKPPAPCSRALAALADRSGRACPDRSARTVERYTCEA